MGVKLLTYQKLILGTSIKMWRENTDSVKIGQKYWTVCMKP